MQKSRQKVEKSRQKSKHRYGPLGTIKWELNSDTLISLGSLECAYDGCFEAFLKYMWIKEIPYLPKDFSYDYKL